MEDPIDAINVSLSCFIHVIHHPTIYFCHITEPFDFYITGFQTIAPVIQATAIKTGRSSIIFTGCNEFMKRYNTTVSIVSKSPAKALRTHYNYVILAYGLMKTPPKYPPPPPPQPPHPPNPPQPPPPPTQPPPHPPTPPPPPLLRLVTNNGYQ